MKIEVYYHIFANQLGAEIAREQLRKIRHFLPTARIWCGLVRAEPDASEQLKPFLAEQSCLEIVAEADAGNEWLTLEVLHRDCREQWPRERPVLYAHTKGAFSSAQHPQIVPEWREWMEYFNFYRWEDAVRMLGEGWTTYGFDAWFNPRRPLLRLLGFRPRFFIYSGNYWWATAGALRRIPVDQVDFTKRHSAEAEFLRRIPRIKAFDALQLIGLPSIPGGAYTNYNDNFQRYAELQNKHFVLDEMRTALGQ